jgi:HAD superfamily hydrolase (TIGR01549 family)
VSSVDADRACGSRRGLLVDFGGVLTNPLGPLMSAFCTANGLREDALALTMAAGHPITADREAHERGELGDAEFAARLAAELGIAPDDVGDLWADLRLDERMFEAVADLRRSGIRTCLVSNSWALDVYPRARLAAAFDGIVISGEVGMRKPELEIFLHAAAVIDVEPRACVLIDDSASNFTGARTAGIAVVHHVGVQTTVSEVRRLFGLDRPASS